MITSPADRAVIATLCPGFMAGVAPEDLDEMLDAWLADDLAHEDHRHVYNHNESNDNA